MQSRLGSLVESLANVFIGYLIAVYALHWALAVVGINIPWSSNYMVGGIMTVVSIVRSYLLRRLFNSFTKRSINHATK